MRRACERMRYKTQCGLGDVRQYGHLPLHVEQHAVHWVFPKGYCSPAQAAAVGVIAPMPSYPSPPLPHAWAGAGAWAGHPEPHEVRLPVRRPVAEISVLSYRMCLRLSWKPRSLRSALRVVSLLP